MFPWYLIGSCVALVSQEPGRGAPTFPTPTLPDETQPETFTQPQKAKSGRCKANVVAAEGVSFIERN